ncbi:splicing factor, suppressor of white-apricot homolog [Phoenix dactylifera]|uniref:Splicing factor, suppressor of white-apricot homolog n=1 Tax=Phoenix dactylifera TaxID=42345 RepID=A0A8B7C3V8_PHODC|nr:splicing factor, suppressor of white-apricot homolog [Phoenix dactylifera]
MDLAVEGRHALLFDDDATAAFVNSRDALVPCAADASLLIDRYDVRHLLDRIPPRPPHRRHLHHEDPGGDVSLSDLNHERYLDLPPPGDGDGDGQGRDLSLPSGTMNGPEVTVSGTYQAVPFSYGDTDGSFDPVNSGSGLNQSCYRPPFPVPESLLSNLPPTEKLHQIIARTAIFVSEHGGQSEIVLRVKQGDNPTFGFLMPDHHLHAYFRFLVDHPQFLRADLDSSRAQEEKKTQNEEDETCAAAGGALSLLGSFYGSGEDDDGAVQADSKGMESCTSVVVANATLTHKLKERESSASKAPEDKEAIKRPAAAAKEKVTSIKRNQLANASIVNSALSKKAGDSGVSRSGAMNKPQNSQPSISNAKPLILEPPTFLKRMMDKIVEFILRNGKEFEAVLIEQDKTTGRFPFLLPSNQYHSYYLKLLQEAREGPAGFKKKVQEAATKESADYDQDSAEPSEGWLYNLQRKEKFKMVIGGPKKDSQEQCSVPARQSGVSTDEAAAIVLAATRGVSPSNARQNVSLDESGPGRMHGEGGRASSMGSLSSFKGQSLNSKPPSNNEGGVSLPTSSGEIKREGSGTIDDVWIAKAIAKTAALVASSEADSSEASLTKEQKLKAERLKRAKMFAAMIKSGSHRIEESVNSATAPSRPLDASAAGSALSGADSDLVTKEREGSSVPFDAEAADRVKSREKGSNYDHERESKSRKNHHPRSKDHDHEEDPEENHKHSRKKHRSEHSSSHGKDERKHRKSHSSKDKESRHHQKHHSPSEDEHRHRKSSSSRHHHHKNHDISEDEDQERKRSGRHHKRKHNSHSERKETEGEDDLGTVRHSESTVRLLNHDQEPGKPAVSDAQPSDATTEIPNELRAKIRAMLLETM